MNFYPIFKPSPDGSLRAMMMGGCQILLFPNDKVTVTGPWSNYRIDGSPFYKDLNKAESSYAGLTAMRDSIIKVATSVKADDEAAVNKIRFEFAAVKQALGEAQIAYIRQHPTSLASALIAQDLLPTKRKIEMLGTSLYATPHHIYASNKIK